ncbi:MAG: hypothetical protein KGN30_03595, partial [Nitrospirota bacterium]|nr:hypothetical protein [Nitrospirota bacterium]
RSLTADRHDILQGSENTEDDEGNDDGDNISAMVGPNSEGNKGALLLSQDLSMSASTQDSFSGEQGLSVDQRDDGYVLSHNLLDAQKAQPILHQNPPSAPRVEQILRDLVWPTKRVV